MYTKTFIGKISREDTDFSSDIPFTFMLHKLVFICMLPLG